MIKKRLIVFGAAEFVYDCAIRTINFDNAEIIAFADNDKYKCDIFFENIPIISPSDLVEQKFDYILIGAWYSYQSIKKQLINIGIEEKKVLPLLEHSKIKWLKDNVTDINDKIISEIFLDGERILNHLTETKDIVAGYKIIDDINEKGKIDYSEYPLIAHACGGYIGGLKQEYTNSLEAFKEALSNGFKMFECDVWGVEKGNIILGSRLKMQYPIEITYTIPTLIELLDLIKNDTKKKLILDLKYNTMDDFYRLLDEVDALAKRFEKKGYLNVREQILIETFDEESTRYATEKKWECLLTDYRNKDGKWVMKSVVICNKYNVHTLMLDASFALKNKKYIDLALNKKVDILCYTVDRIDDYAALRNMGVKSCLTNFLKPVVKMK